jgi:aspartyl-tRNA(Asn)/glutamyl-tRNA(Gln) amidotransferase subunit B
VRDGCGNAKLAANWLMGDVSKRLNADGLSIERAPLAMDQLAALIRRVVDGTVSNSGARQVFDALWNDAGIATQRSDLEASATIDAYIETKGLRQMSDSGALEAVVDAVIAAHAKSVDEFRAGKEKAFNALVGQIMKASQGKANPAQAGEVLRRKLTGG